MSILQARGFSADRRKGSHEQFVGEVGGRRRIVTVDHSVNQYADMLMKSMIRQSGLNREQFYCATKATAKKIGMRYQAL